MPTTQANVQPLLWGDNAHIAHARSFLPPSSEGYDLLLCSDVLWMTSSHDVLLSTLLTLLAPEGRVLIISGLHTGRRPVAAFFTLAAQHGLVPDWQAPAHGVWERFQPPGQPPSSVPWRGDPALPEYNPEQGTYVPPVKKEYEPGWEPEYDERAHWSICALLRRLPHASGPV